MRVLIVYYFIKQVQWPPDSLSTALSLRSLSINKAWWTFLTAAPHQRFVMKMIQSSSCQRNEKCEKCPLELSAADVVV